jgi:site-specific DNA recombinase
MRVVLYARVSSEKQAEKDLSIPAQLKELSSYAAKNGHVIVRQFVDAAETGKTTDRPGFREMISLSKAKEPLFEGILVWKMSRFARNREDSIIYKSLLRKKGIQVISINEPIEDSPSGKLLEGIIEVIDEYYSDNLAQDVLRGMREAAAKGFFVGGKPPYGYHIVKVTDRSATRSRLALHEAESSVVSRMFHKSLRGRGIKEITKGLNQDGILNRAGKTWSCNRVYEILTNEVYTGTFIWDRSSRKGGVAAFIRVQHAWPAIVDSDTFSKVQAAMSLRSPRVTRPRSVTSNYLLGGLMRCKQCGTSMTGQMAKSGKFFYYRCSNALRKGPAVCTTRWLPKKKIEGFIIDRIRDSLLTENNLAELVNMVNDEIKDAKHEEKKTVKALELQCSDFDSRLNKLYDAVETGKIPLDNLAPRIDALIAQKAELQKNLSTLRDGADESPIAKQDIELIRRYVEDLNLVLACGSVTEQKSFIRSFVRDIEVARDEVTINYTLPMPPTHKEAETLEVLAFKRFGRPCRNRTCDPLIKSQLLYQLS